MHQERKVHGHKVYEEPLRQSGPGVLAAKLPRLGLASVGATGSQVNNLREIQALRRLSPHPGIIKLAEVLYDQPTGRLALVFELMDMNIYELIRGRRHYLPEGRVKGTEPRVRGP